MHPFKSCTEYKPKILSKWTLAFQSLAIWAFRLMQYTSLENFPQALGSRTQLQSSFTSGISLTFRRWTTVTLITFLNCMHAFCTSPFHGQNFCTRALHNYSHLHFFFFASCTFSNNGDLTVPVKTVRDLLLVDTNLYGKRGLQNKEAVVFWAKQPIVVSRGVSVTEMAERTHIKQRLSIACPRNLCRNSRHC